MSLVLPTVTSSLCLGPVEIPVVDPEMTAAGDLYWVGEDTDEDRQANLDADSHDL